MKLHPTSHEPGVSRYKGNKQTYCGPGALSAIMGVTAEEAARLLNRQWRPDEDENKKITGTPEHIMLRTLKDLGVKAEEIDVVRKQGTRAGRWDQGYHPHDEMYVNRNETLNQWFKRRDKETRDSLCLLVIGNHFVVVKGSYIADNQQGNIHFSKSKHKKKRVNSVWRLVRNESS